MKISPIINFKQISKQNNIISTQRINTKSDTISFSSAIDRKLNSKSSVNATNDFIEQVTKNINDNGIDFKQIEQIAQQNIPIISIDDIKNLEKIIGQSAKDVFAYTHPVYGDDCKLSKITIFIPRFKKPNEIFIGTLAHEYCHCYQRYIDETYMGLATLTNQDLIASRTLNYIAGVTFSTLEKLRYIDVIENTNKLMQNGINGTEALRISYGCKSEKELYQSLKSVFLQYSDAIIEKAKTMPEIRKNIEAFIDNPILLKKTIREQCKKRAELELEAYTAQKNAIKTFKANSLTAENIVNPIFYNALANALS